MTVQKRSYRALGACCLGVAGLVLAAGCSAAPPGATHNSPAVGPTRATVDEKNFPVFPLPAKWNGQGNVDFTMVVKPSTGTAKRNFRVIAQSDMVFFLNCLGKGKAQLASSAMGFKWDISCSSKGIDPQGINFRPTAAAVGHGANVLVTVTKGAKWEVRIDAPVK